MDYRKITCQECKDNFKNFGKRAVIENGQVVEFEQEGEQKKDK